MALREIPSPGFVESVKETLTVNYAKFSGRARRSEFWYFELFEIIVGIVCNIITGIFGVSEAMVSNSYDAMSIIGLLIFGVINLALLLPSLGVSVRRLHDVNKSGWLLLLVCIPLIGAIILLCWFCKDSDPLPNQYGASPKYQDDDAI